MTDKISGIQRPLIRTVMSLIALLAILAVACGASAPEEAAPAAAEPAAAPQLAEPAALAIPATTAPAAQETMAKPAESMEAKPADTMAKAAESDPAQPAQAAASAASPTAAPAPTAAPPPQVESVRDTLIFVTNEEPTTIGAASPNCGGNIQNTICDDMVSDPLTWIDDHNNFKVVGMTGIEGWEQIDADRWRFQLRQGVTFHNGAPWNAEQAAFWIDFFGDEETSGHHNSNDFSFHGVIGGEVVDDYTLDVVCGTACPILPRTTIFTKFQDVEWFLDAVGATSANDLPIEFPAEIHRNSVGLGPYKIVEWRSGIEIELEANEDYNPNPATSFSQAPSINTVIQQWRNEPAVRASMLQAGEADWAEIAIDDRDRVPKWVSATNNEVFRFTIDTIFDPELSKKDVRAALNHAVDCQTILEQIYGGLVSCYGNIAQVGTVGITEYNSAPHAYDPDLAMQLLQQANYDPEHEIVLTMRSNRIPKDVEVGEAYVTSWNAVGIKATLNVVESSVYSQIHRSTCGHQRTREEIANAAGADLHAKCVTLGPGPPRHASLSVAAGPTSTESLDYSRQAVLRNSCYSRSSGVCYQDLQDMIEEAGATPTGDLRVQRMETIADYVHDNFHFVHGFQVVSVYALSEGLEWTPHYAPRVRANTMYFSK
ncbi:MAG: ABC transporter substrate-binding protein [Chloroflexi bacterium]|nr:ABC transporter substrate-binding protein [Chloroflexota bacterium]